MQDDTQETLEFDPAKFENIDALYTAAKKFAMENIATDPSAAMEAAFTSHENIAEMLRERKDAATSSPSAKNVREAFGLTEEEHATISEVMESVRGTVFDAIRSNPRVSVGLVDALADYASGVVSDYSKIVLSSTKVQGTEEVAEDVDPLALTAADLEELSKLAKTAETIASMSGANIGEFPRYKSGTLKFSRIRDDYFASGYAREGGIPEDVTAVLHFEVDGVELDTRNLAEVCLHMSSAEYVITPSEVADALKADGYNWTDQLPEAYHVNGYALTITREEV